MQALRWKHIVVVIVDPFNKDQVVLSKAADIAARCGAKLTLLNTFMLPQPTPDTVLGLNKKNIKLAITDRHARLEHLAAPLRRQGIRVNAAVEWDYPVQDAVVRYVLRHKPDLLLTDSHRRGRIARWFLNNTDWELIRNCPCALWFVRDAALPRSPQVLVAVDPRHTHDKPARLDDRLLQTAKSLTSQLGGKILLAHAYEIPTIVVPSPLTEPFPVPIPASQAKAFVAATKKAVTLLSKKHGIAATALRLREGEPSHVLANLAQQCKTHVLVMGVVSRRLLQRPFIGNTAEKLIDQTDCDVLVVKPAEFKSPVFKKRPSL